MLEKLFSFSNSCLKGGGGLFNIFSILGDLRNFWQNIHPWPAGQFSTSDLNIPDVRPGRAGHDKNGGENCQRPVLLSGLV